MTRPARLRSIAVAPALPRPLRHATTRLPEHGPRRARTCSPSSRRWRARSGRAGRTGYASGAVYHGDARARRVPHRGLRAALADQPAARRPVAERHEVRGRDRRHDRARMLGADGPRTRSVGTVSLGRHREHPAGDEGVPRPRRRTDHPPRWSSPTTAHAAFDKAAQYFGIRAGARCRWAPTCAPTSAATAARSTTDTIVVVGSAPAFPHGLIDPIEELSELRARARRRLPHRRLPRRLRAAVGASSSATRAAVRLPPARRDLDVVRHAQVRLRRQGHVGRALPRRRAAPRASTSPSPTGPAGSTCRRRFAGSRPGALSAACWAAMVVDRRARATSTRRGAILEAAARIKAGHRGDRRPARCSATRCSTSRSRPTRRLDIYRVLDAMAHRGWSLNGLHRPPALHLCTTLRHTAAGRRRALLADLATRSPRCASSPRPRAGWRRSTGWRRRCRIDRSSRMFSRRTWISGTRSENARYRSTMPELTPSSLLPDAAAPEAAAARRVAPVGVLRLARRSARRSSSPAPAGTPRLAAPVYASASPRLFGTSALYHRINWRR